MASRARASWTRAKETVETVPSGCLLLTRLKPDANEKSSPFQKLSCGSGCAPRILKKRLTFSQLFCMTGQNDERGEKTSHLLSRRSRIPSRRRGQERRIPSPVAPSAAYGNGPARIFPSQTPAFPRRDFTYRRPLFPFRRAISICWESPAVSQRADSLCGRMDFVPGRHLHPIGSFGFCAPAGTFPVPAVATPYSGGQLPCSGSRPPYSGAQPRPCRTRNPFNSIRLNTQPNH